MIGNQGKGCPDAKKTSVLSTNQPKKISLGLNFLICVSALNAGTQDYFLIHWLDRVLTAIHELVTSRKPQENVENSKEHLIYLT
jgi:hypothetical protein